MFEKIDILNMNLKVFSLINDDWMLITAGNIENHNMMTASWGGFGILWHKPAATIYVRPQRHTKKFLDNEDLFTISFFDERFRDVLKFCGTNSGKNVNKTEKTNLTPKIFDGSVAFEEASLVFVCKKKYCNKLDESKFLDPNIEKDFYKEKDFHYLYIAEILDVFKKTN